MTLLTESVKTPALRRCDVTAVYDPFDPAFQADPYPAYRALRDAGPVHRHEDPHFFALSRFADVWQAVKDPQTYSSAQGLTFYPDEIATLALAPTTLIPHPPPHPLAPP